MKAYTLLFVILFLSQISVAQKTKIERIEPLFWWTDMKNPSLQLMIYGEGIAAYTPEIDYPNVEISSVNPMESPNYLIIYLNVQNALPGKFDITLRDGKNKLKYEYELKKRVPRTKVHEGFNSSDVVYLIMPDRFANGNPDNDLVDMKEPYIVDRKDMRVRHGGDLAGIIKNLDYLENLGVTSLWLTPVQTNDMGSSSYHGYAATDYYNIDPRLGSNEEYLKLSEELHERGMKLIMDMVFNHCGSKHPWNIDRPMADWFNSTEEYVQTNHAKSAVYDPYAAKVDAKILTDGWFVTSMPDFNQRNRFVADYLIQNSIWWIEYAGLNGIRQDTYPYPDYDVMVRWCEEVMREYPDFNIVGEAWVSDPMGAAFWQRGNKMNPNDTKLKSVMDFRLQSIANSVFNETPNWGTGITRLYEHMSYDFAYPDINNVLRFYENHDTDRFMKEMPKSLDAFRQATVFLLTIPGIPQLYYAQELAIHGITREDYAFVRTNMIGGWQEDARSVFTKQGRTPLEDEAHSFMSKILAWRKGNDIIAHGDMKHFALRNNVYVYSRAYNGKRFIVLMNGEDKSNSVELESYKEVLNGSTSAQNIINDKQITLSKSLTLTPREVMILEL